MANVTQYQLSVTQDYGVFTNISINETVTNHGLKVIDEPYELIWSPDVVFRVTTLVVVMILTLIGNSTLIAIITFHRKLRRKRVNVFLVNLAVGDLMVCLVTMTTEILFVAFGEWVMGGIACKLVVYGQIVTLASATFLLTAMSIDRYQVLVRPLQALAGQPKIWRKVLIAWTMAFVFATPQLLIFVQTDEGVRPDGSIKHLCRSKGYTAQWQRKVYFSFLTTYILIIPTIIMSFCYINIIRVVWMRTDSKHRPKPKFRMRFSSNRRLLATRNGTSNADHEMTIMNPYASECDGSERLVNRRDAMPHNNLTIPKKLVSSSKRNVVKMTLSVIMGFVICWTPYFVVGLLRIFSDYKIQLSHAYAAAEIMALVHSAMNPILYGIFSTKAVKKVCGSMCQKFKRSNDIVIRYETTALSDDETTWAETKFTRINGPDFANTNCNARSSSPGRRGHLHRVINLIKGKCTRKKASKPITRVMSHQYSPLVRNGAERRTYIEMTDRSCLISATRGGQNCVIVNHHAPFSDNRHVINRHNVTHNAALAAKVHRRHSGVSQHTDIPRCYGKDTTKMEEEVTITNPTDASTSSLGHDNDEQTSAVNESAVTAHISHTSNKEITMENLN